MERQAKQPLILVVEDEDSIRQMIRFVLEAEQFTVVLAEDTRAAEVAMADAMPDLMLLDWMLPGTSGVQFAERLKLQSTTQSLPIILLTAKAEEANIVRGFESGVDDYIVKPFSPKELVARIRAILRRGIVRNPKDEIHVGEVRLDCKAHVAYHHEAPIKLSAFEFRLLAFFLSHKNRTYSREELIALLWRDQKDISDRTVDVHIRRLRIALSQTDLAQSIQTVHRAGYRFAHD